MSVLSYGFKSLNDLYLQNMYEGKFFALTLQSFNDAEKVETGFSSGCVLQMATQAHRRHVLETLSMSHIPPAQSPPLFLPQALVLSHIVVGTEVEQSVDSDFFGALTIFFCISAELKLNALLQTERHVGQPWRSSTRPAGPLFDEFLYHSINMN